MDPRPSLRARMVLGAYVVCFALAGLNHARDFLALGWRPYYWGPRPLEVFWTSLIILDALAIAALLSRHKAIGLLLSVGIMLADVAANTYALVVLDIPEFGVSVPLQATFLGFILGSLPFVWPRRTREKFDTRRSPGVSIPRSTEAETPPPPSERHLKG